MNTNIDLEKLRQDFYRVARNFIEDLGYELSPDQLSQKEIAECLDEAVSIALSTFEDEIKYNPQYIAHEYARGAIMRFMEGDFVEKMVGLGIVKRNFH
jgi:hypothetical protein